MIPAAALFILTLAAFPFPAGAGEARAASNSPPPCVTWSIEARFNGVAYSHLVHLTNGCKTDMKCRVTTNVNPEPVEAELKIGDRKTVLTVQGSSAREFTAQVRCEKK
jgi:hypothetical protein